MPVTVGGGGGSVGLDKLTRRHAVKLSPSVNCTVEECSLAVGEVVGHGSVKSASRMNSAVVIFLDCVNKVNTIVEQGVVIQDTLIPVLPLVSPARKVILSNVPPFLKNEVLERELGRHGQLVSSIKMIPLGCKSPLLKHVVSFRRHVFMILKNENSELNIAFKFKVDNFDYIIFATSDTMKCFWCGKEGHLIRSCPEKKSDDRTPTSQAGTSGSEKEKDQAPSVGSNSRDRLEKTTVVKEGLVVEEVVNVNVVTDKGPVVDEEEGGSGLEEEDEDEDEDEGGDSQDEGKGKMGKGQPELKTEVKTEVRLSTLTY